jgi:uncharacterized membrane protein YhaH (DUF805 family)
MSFIEAVQSCFRNYVGFSGRAARSEYWYWVLFAILVDIATNLIDAGIGSTGHFGVVTIIAGLILLLPGIAVSARRLHDRNKSGWFLLLGLIPIVGPIILIIWFCMRGTPGPNRFGPDPLEISLIGAPAAAR